MSTSELHEDRQQPELPLANRWVKYPLIGRLFRFLTWWLVFTGIYASSSVCPFCGRVGCPVGGISAGVVGAFFALVIEQGKSFLIHLGARFSWLRTKWPLNPKSYFTKK